MRPATERLAFAALLSVMASCAIQIDEKDLLFPWPARLPEFAPDIQRRNVEVRTGDGVALRGWLLDVPDERFTLIFFYGNGQSVVGMATELYTLAGELRADVICLDYRGYGFSDGRPTFADVGRDALRIFDHARTLAGTRPVVVFGYSFGSASAIVIGAQRAAEAVVLVAPPSSPQGIVDHIESRLPWYARMFFHLEPAPALRRLDPVPETAIRDLTEPLLIVHGTADTVVPFASGKNLFGRAPGPVKRFCTIPGEDHAMALYAVQPYRDCVVEFLASIGTPAAPVTPPETRPAPPSPGRP